MCTKATATLKHTSKTGVRRAQVSTTEIVMVPQSLHADVFNPLYWEWSDQALVNVSCEINVQLLDVYVFREGLLYLGPPGGGGGSVANIATYLKVY